MIIESFDTDKKVLIIAEIGNNHEGSYTLAEEMIGRAAEAGADAVKFQAIVPEKLVSVKERDRIRQLEKFRLSRVEFEKLSQVAKKNDVLFLVTPFDIESVHFLDPLVPAFKIASGDNNFFPLIEVLAETGKPLIFSSGLANLKEMKRTKDFVEQKWRLRGIKQSLAILHCIVSYPTAPEDANLLAIRALQKLKVTVGYSDHTQGIDAAVLSVALGARVIEKHFTISKNHSSFRDHQLSADPPEMASLVRRVREASQLLGEGVKQLRDCEKENQTKVRRSIVARHPLKKGKVISLEDIDWVRPGTGLEPGREKEIIGKRLKRSLEKGETILIPDTASRKRD